jgi:uncharacterized protein (TIGR03083 family)
MDAPQAEHIRFIFDPGATLVVLAGQRRRFAATAAILSAEELAVPSRCEGWTVADVLRHLVWVDATMRKLWSGDESPVVGFDPRTTPDEAVRADRAVPDEEIRQRFLVSTEAMALELESAGPERFGAPSVSPAGRVPWWLSVMHVGWDSTIHERDVLGPLQRQVDPVPQETMASLAYSLVLASLFDRHGPLEVHIGPVRLSSGRGPATVWVADDGAGGDDASRPSDDGPAVLDGDLVAAVDALSGREPLAAALHGDAAAIDRLGGLARFFTSRS